MVDVLVGQPLGQPLALAPTLIGQYGVGRTLGTFHTHGQTVAHEEQVHGVGP